MGRRGGCRNAVRASVRVLHVILPPAEGQAREGKDGEPKREVTKSRGAAMKKGVKKMHFCTFKTCEINADESDRKTGCNTTEM